MSTAEPACYSTPEESGLRVETLSFDRIPHQSRLFLDYLRDPVALREFYPSAVRFHHELPARAPEVLAAYQDRSNALCDALAGYECGWGAGEETLKNIELLARRRLSRGRFRPAGRIVFRSALHDLQSALGRETRGMSDAAQDQAVPVFWIATEDHDFPEVAKAEFIGRDCKLGTGRSFARLASGRSTGGRVVIDDSINAVVDQLLELLPSSEFTPDLEAIVRDAWRPGRVMAKRLRA